MWGLKNINTLFMIRGQVNYRTEIWIPEVWLQNPWSLFCFWIWLINLFRPTSSPKATRKASLNKKKNYQGTEDLRVQDSKDKRKPMCEPEYLVTFSPAGICKSVDKCEGPRSWVDIQQSPWTNLKNESWDAKNR